MYVQRKCHSRDASIISLSVRSKFRSTVFYRHWCRWAGQEDIARETAGLGLGQDTVAGATGVQVAAAMGGGTFSPNSYGMPGHDVNFASDIYMGPGYGGGGGRRHCFGGGRRLQQIIPGNDWKR